MAQMPTNCKVADRAEIPIGFNKVEFVRHGYLFVIVDKSTVKIKNPFDYIPLYVKLSKEDDCYKIVEGKTNGSH